MKRLLPGSVLAGALLLPSLALAEDGVTPGQFTANNVWMMLAAGLVFIMHLGFATLESGMTRAKMDLCNQRPLKTSIQFHVKARRSVGCSHVSGFEKLKKNPKVNCRPCC